LSLLNYLVESNRNIEKEDLQVLNKNIKDIKLASLDRSSYTPISVKNNTDWELLTNPERLRKIYQFDTKKECMYFFNELYNYQFIINHHCKIIIDNLTMQVETYTHGLNGITSLDKKITKFCDELEGDLNYFKSK
jgi:pterin-4a-carbinolamine dehydratase